MTEIPSAGRTTGSLNEPYPSAASSFGQLFLTRVEKTPSKEAFRKPTADGGWRSYTWAETLEETKEAAAGLVALGVNLEDRVSIACNTRLEWILADLAIMLAGAATTTVYPSTSPEDVVYILGDSGTVCLIAEDMSQVAKADRGQLPEVKNFIVIDGEASGADVITWDQLREKGRALLAENPNLIQERVDQTTPESLATLIYTSGTTGKPKGVELTHGNWTYEGAAIDAIGILEPDDVQFLWLPLAHSFGKVLMSAQLQVGFVTAVDGRVPEIINNLPVVRPTFMAAVPRIFEKVHAGVNRQVKEDGGAKEKIFGWAFNVGKRAQEKRMAGEKVGGMLGMQLGLADKLVFSKVRERMGGNVRYFVSGSAALSRDINNWFDIVGLTILEGYGLTETSAATTLVRPENFMTGTVGQPFPGTEIKIADDGEIMVRGPGVMREYRNRPEANQEVFGTNEGGEQFRWFATGDIGVIDEKGRVKITDRKKDLVKTSGGKYIAPGAIEAQFKANTPLAGAVVVVANEKNFASALVGLDPDAAKLWAEAHGKPTDIPTLAADPDVKAEIQKGVDALNAKLNKWETIKEFRIIPKELTVDEGFLTPSLKVKRKEVEKQFTGLIDDIYGGGSN